MSRETHDAEVARTAQVELDEVRKVIEELPSMKRARVSAMFLALVTIIKADTDVATYAVTWLYATVRAEQARNKEKK